jgi:transcriptional regulator with XRE-family HTH domain
MARKRKPPADHDRYVGERIREARIAEGFSQAELGDRLGVSFQQVQKYEKGVNRLTSSRLELLVSALNRPLAYFFPNLTDVRRSPLFGSFLADKQAQQLAALWPSLSPSSRRALLKMGEHLAQEEC